MSLNFGITSDMITLFNNALDAILADDGLVRLCRLLYKGTKYEDCPNCLNTVGYDTGSVYSSSHAQSLRHTDPCPVCGGTGIRLVEPTDTLYLAVIWEYKDFIEIERPVYIPDGSVQTLSRTTETLDKIKQANEIIIDTDIEQYKSHRFKRNGKPNPCGFGTSRYITTLWSPA